MVWYRTWKKIRWLLFLFMVHEILWIKGNAQLLLDDKPDDFLHVELVGKISNRMKRLWEENVEGIVWQEEDMKRKRDFRSDVIMINGRDLMHHASTIEKALKVDSKPVIIVKPDKKQLRNTLKQANLPLYLTGDSDTLLIDTFRDEAGREHVRLMNHVKSEQIIDPTRIVTTDADLDTDDVVVNRENISAQHYKRGIDQMLQQTERFLNKTKHAIKEVTHNDFYTKVQEYLQHCRNEEECTRFMSPILNQQNSRILNLNRTKRGEDSDNMVPPAGAMFRAHVATDFYSQVVRWTKPHRFVPEQLFTSRIDIYWYIYLQGPPEPTQYQVIALLDGMNNANMMRDEDYVKGFFLSNFEIRFSAAPVDGPDPKNFFWRRSRPNTVNSRHTLSRLNNLLETQTFTLGLQMQASLGEPFMSNTLTTAKSRTFQLGFTHTRDITDWAIVEKTDPIFGTGIWNYYQVAPVDMNAHNQYNFQYNSRDYLENGYLRSIPNLSKSAAQSHQSIWWAVDPSLKTTNGTLELQFVLEVPMVLTAIARIPDVNKMYMAQTEISPRSNKWIIDIADMNSTSFINLQSPQIN